MVQQNTWIAHTAPQDVVDGMEQHVKCKHATHIAIPNKIDLFFSQYSWSQMQTYLLETPVKDTALVFAAVRWTFQTIGLHAKRSLD